MSLAFPFKAAPRVDVLIVDDNPFMRAAVARILTRSGRQCMAVESVDAAKMIMLRHPPAIVLTDFSLSPRETGVDLVRWIRSQPDLRHVTCGMMTGSDAHEIQSTLAAAGLDPLSVLEKPFGLGDLESWVDQLAANHNATTPLGVSPALHVPRRERHLPSRALTSRPR